MATMAEWSAYLLVLADGTAEADAEKAVKAASRMAEAAVSKAVQAAAAAGLEYRPPPDMQLDTHRVPKVKLPTLLVVLIMLTCC